MRRMTCRRPGSAGRVRLGTAGAAAVELALATPVLVTLVVGGVDFGALFNNGQALAAAVRGGAEYARNSATCQQGIDVLNSPQITSACIQGVQNAVNSAKFGSALATPASVSLACYCDQAGGGFAAQSAIACGDNSCATQGRGNNEVFVQVSASQAVSPLMPWPGFPTTLNAVTELRLQ